MHTHKLKSWPEFFKAIRDGDKLHDVRRTDRDFQVGDLIIFEEWDPILEKYTGLAVTRQITYITSADLPCPLFENAISKGFCILSIDMP